MDHVLRLAQPQQTCTGNAIHAIALMVVALGLAALAFAAPPPIGWTTQATVVRTKDGDTCRVRIVREFDVRLRNCWAKELREPGGPEARDHLKSLIDGREVVVHIPGNMDLSKMTSLSRFVGDVHVGDIDVAEAQRAAGHATAEKQR